ncbi:MAG: pilin [Candidatus Pacebacteria bacterium]|nr:pilin [Candidatus Paceibacterota bacterium]
MKKSQIKKSIFFFTLLTFSFFIYSNVFATEIYWPLSPMGTGLPDYQTVSLSQFTQYFYEWGISLGALFAFISVVVAGFQYLTSTGDPKKIAEAQNRIKASFFGLALLLGTYLILNTINPQLVSLDINPKGGGGDDLVEYETKEYELISECAYAKLYKDAAEMKKDERNGFPKSSGVVVDLDWAGRYSKSEHSDSTIYNAVKFFSKPTLMLRINKYLDGELQNPDDDAQDLAYENYPETYKRQLIEGEKDDNGNVQYYIPALGTECKLYLYNEPECAAAADLWDGVANVTYSTNYLSETTTAKIDETQCYKLIKNE